MQRSLEITCFIPIVEPSVPPLNVLNVAVVFQVIPRSRPISFSNVAFFSVLPDYKLISQVFFLETSGTAHFSKHLTKYLWNSGFLFQSEFSTECVLVLTLSIYSTLSFPQGLPVAAYVIFVVFPSFLSFSLSFRQLGVLEVSSKWFHSLLIRTTMHPFLNELRISANSCSYLPVCTSVRIPHKWIFERRQ
jgi:hypothetical protein